MKKKADIRRIIEDPPTTEIPRAESDGQIESNVHSSGIGFPLHVKYLPD